MQKPPNQSSCTIQPAVLWFTGLSGAGKSTIADRLAPLLTERGIPVERLDGDQMRDRFPGTGFTKPEREAHLLRVGYMAALLEKHGVTVLATFISPYADTRRKIREMCRNFVEVYVAAPLDICEQRDVKGLYRRARQGEIQNFTGISDPYEPPPQPELTLDTASLTIEAAVTRTLQYLLSSRTPAN